MNEYVWIVGGSIMQLPILEEAKRRGFKVIVTDGNERCVAAHKADIFRSVDTYDTVNNVAFAKHLKDTQHLSIRAVVCPGVDVGPTVSAIAEILSLPAVSHDVARRVRDKAMMRIVTGFPHPRYLFVSSTASSYSGYWNTYPCVVKPVDNCASRGISLVKTREELLPAIAFALKSNKRALGAVVEELLHGIEYALDFLIVERKAVWVNGVTRLFRHHVRGSSQELFGIEGAVINPFVAPEELCDLATTAARRLGVKEGPFKVDAMYDERYGWCVLECATRFSGGWDHTFLAPMVGRNITSVLLDYALGLEVNIPPIIPNRYSVSYTPYYAPGKIHWYMKGTGDIDSKIGRLNVYPNAWGSVFFRSHEEILPLNTCADRPVFFHGVGNSPLGAFRNTYEISKMVTPIYRGEQ